jgi:hypothetical protein
MRKMLVLVVFILGFGNIFAQNLDFEDAGYLCVVVNNTVRWYARYNNFKKEEKSLAFNLPDGYKSVFGYGVINTYLCVVVDNTVRWYDPNKNFKEETSLAFNLPKGYKSVFANAGYLCIVVGNTVRWYSPDNVLFLHEKNLKEETSLAFNLPDGYKSVFGYGIINVYLCVVVGNTVRWYNPNNNFKEEKSLEFNLLDGYKSVFGIGGI